MAITNILRDWASSVSIVRIMTTDTLATVESAGYLKAQEANIERINIGPFAWVPSDFILVYASDGWSFFTIMPDFSGFNIFQDNITFPITIAQGGTNATTAAGARTNLGLGTIATQNANAVAITGGSASLAVLRAPFAYQSVPADITLNPTNSLSAFEFTTNPGSTIDDDLGLASYTNGYTFSLFNTTGGDCFFVPFAGEFVNGLASLTIPNQGGFLIQKNPDQWSIISEGGTAVPTGVTFTGNSGTPFTGSAVSILGGSTGLTFVAGTPNLTLTGILALANGGTNANLTASNGGIFYSTATAGAILAGTATARQMLQSGASTIPAWSTAVWPATTTINNLLFSSTANVVGQISSGANGVLISSAGNVPSWLANGTTGQVLTATTGAPATWTTPSSSSITFTSDTGTPFSNAAVTIFANNATNLSGGSVLFDATTPNITLKLSDVNLNTYLGNLTGSNNVLFAGGNNTAVGNSAMQSVAGAQLSCAFGLASLATNGSGAGNSAFGARSLVNLNGGGNNTAIGQLAGSSYTSTESNNIVIGSNVLGTNGESNTIRIGTIGTQTKCYIAACYSNFGTRNTFVGVNSGNTTLTVGAATDNTFVGVDVAPTITTSTQNVVVGSSAGGTISSGGGNVLIGYAAGNNIQTGFNNTVIGTIAATGLTGPGNIVIGRNAGSSLTNANDAIIIGNVGTNIDANLIRIGTPGTHNTAFISGISGVSVSNLNIVTIDTTTGQLGSEAATALSTTFTGDSGTPFATNSVKITSGISTDQSGATVSFNAATPNISLSVSDTSQNTFIGLKAGNAYNAGSAFNNTIIGAYAVTPPTITAYSNTGIGAGILQSLTSGFYNTCLGVGAGQATSTGNDNTFIGSVAGGPISSGNYCTAIGSQTLSNNAVGSYNIAIGYFSGNTLATNNANNILINHLGVSGDNNTIRIGTQGSGANQQSKCYVAGIAGGAISAGSPTFGAVIIDTSDGQLVSATTGISTSGFVLTSNGTATAPTWKVVAGSATFTGDTGTPFTSSSVTISSGLSSNSCGETVWFDASTPNITLHVGDGANQNMFLGQHCGKAGYSGINNCFVGPYNTGAPMQITTGYSNSAFGAGALNSLTTGIYNTGIGVGAGDGLSTQSYSTFIGAGAGAAVSNGQYNTALGAQVLDNNDVSDYNIAIGYNSGNNLNAGSTSNILINSLGVSGDSHTIRIGTQGSGANQQQLCYIAGITGSTPTSANTPQVTVTDNAGNISVISSSTSGFVLTSNGAATPSFQAPAAAGIVNVNQTTSSATLIANRRYATNNGASLVTYTIPAGAAVGDTYIIIGGSSGGWTMAQPASVTCHITAAATTTGVGGSISSTNQYDCITITCVASNVFTGYAIQSAGLTIV